MVGIIAELLLEGGMDRKGDDVLRRRDEEDELDRLRLGERLRSDEDRRSPSNTDDRTGEVNGNPSSAGLRGVRTRLGEADGLAGRSCGE